MVVIIIGVFYAPLNNKIEQFFWGTPIYSMLNNEEVMNLHQVITKDSSNSRTIIWQSFTNSDDYILEYKLDDNNIIKVSPTKDILTIDDKTIYIYTVILKDLTANTKYQYRIGLKNHRSDWYDLQTEDKEKKDFKVLIFPDSQSNDYTDWQNLAMNAWQKNKDSKFFINMGDLVDNGYALSQWNSWFNSVESMISTIPIATVQGNHETYTTDWQVAMPEPYLKLFNLPSNGQESFKNQYYSFDYGDVHFTVLNTQDDEMADFEPNLLNVQQAWLEQDLANTKKKWKIVLMHRDILNYGRDAKPLGDKISFSRHGEIYMPIFDKYNVDAVLTAHLHTYRRRALLKNFIKDKKGTLYILTGVAGNVRYPNLWHQNPLDEYIAPQPETNNYMVLSATENSLTFSCYLPNNEQIDTIILRK